MFKRWNNFSKTIFLFLLVIIFSGMIFSLIPVTSGTISRPAGYYPGDPIPDHVAYLTFDDGPSDWTGMVLDTLKSRKVKATFFICANWQPKSTRQKNSFIKYKSALVRMIKEGHAIGNHTRSHPNLDKESPEDIVSQLDYNQALFNRELGELAVPMTLIRPPYGKPWFNGDDQKSREKVGSIIASRGLMILWSRHFYSGDSMDWVKGDWYEAGPKINIDHAEFKSRMLNIYNRLIKRVNGGGMIILFHDTHRTTVETLPLIIDKLTELGYRFGTIEDYARWRWGKGSQELIREYRQQIMVDAQQSLTHISIHPDKRINKREKEMLEN